MLILPVAACRLGQSRAGPHAAARAEPAVHRAARTAALARLVRKPVCAGGAVLAWCAFPLSFSTAWPYQRAQVAVPLLPDLRSTQRGTSLMWML